MTRNFTNGEVVGLRKRVNDDSEHTSCGFGADPGRQR